MSPFGCDIPFHSSPIVAGLTALIVHLFFKGNQSHIRSIFRIVQHLEGDRMQLLLSKIASAGIRVFVVAGAWELDPVMGILRTARRIHDAVPLSTLHVVPRGTHNTWTDGTEEKQRCIRDHLLAFLHDEAGISPPTGPNTRLLGFSA